MNFSRSPQIIHFEVRFVQGNHKTILWSSYIIQGITKNVNKPTFLDFLLQGGDHHGGGGQGEGGVGQRLPRARLLSLLCQSRPRHDPKRRSLFIKGSFSTNLFS